MSLHPVREKQRCFDLLASHVAVPHYKYNGTWGERERQVLPILREKRCGSVEIRAPWGINRRLSYQAQVISSNLRCGGLRVLFRRGVAHLLLRLPIDPLIYCQTTKL